MLSCEFMEDEIVEKNLNDTLGKVKHLIIFIGRGTTLNCASVNNKN